jgi:hypothetical protein
LAFELSLKTGPREQRLANLEWLDRFRTADRNAVVRTIAPCTDNRCNSRFERATTYPHRCAADAARAKARAAYQDFLMLWGGADADIPVLKQAKAEYAKLR